ncbi:MAG: hypothetical protein K6F28_04395 [Lachnospiraceae bacterium]|nr:hypothetical protein [Lachnospiraceae bacterium]
MEENNKNKTEVDNEEDNTTEEMISDEVMDNASGGLSVQMPRIDNERFQ